MKIQAVNKQVHAKKRSLNPNQMDTVRTLLTQMNQETEVKRNEYTFNSTVTKSLQYKDKATFIDGRMIFEKVPAEKQMTKETLFTIGKTQLVIDNKTGQIIDYYKPFLTRWSKIISNIDKYLKIFKENFNNPNIVKKKKITMEGFTQAGYEIMQKMLKK